MILRNVPLIDIELKNVESRYVSESSYITTIATLRHICEVSKTGDAYEVLKYIATIVMKRNPLLGIELAYEVDEAEVTQECMRVDKNVYMLQIWYETIYDDRYVMTIHLYFPEKR